MDLADAATETPEIQLAEDLTGVYVLTTTELEQADQVTDPGQFPEYGQFLPCESVSDPGETVYLEAVQELAAGIMSHDPDLQDVFVVTRTRKPDPEGSWDVDVEQVASKHDIDDLSASPGERERLLELVAADDQRSLEDVEP